jgi:hypothetical protein
MDYVIGPSPWAPSHLGTSSKAFSISHYRAVCEVDLLVCKTCLPTRTTNLCGSHRCAKILVLPSGPDCPAPVKVVPDHMITPTVLVLNAVRGAHYHVRHVRFTSHLSAASVTGWYAPTASRRCQRVPAATIFHWAHPRIYAIVAPAPGAFSLQQSSATVD